MFKNEKAKNAFMIGTLCALSYLGVYIARNMLGAVTPQMVESGTYTNEYIGTVSSLFFMAYAFGQLINGLVGQKIKPKFMLGFGMILAGISSFIFPHTMDNIALARISYALMGFFLSMIYAPMTKVVAENTDPLYTPRCSLGYEFSSLFGSPLAGMLAAVMTWIGVFYVGSSILVIMGIICFITFTYFEKKGIVKHYVPKKSEEESRQGIKILFKHNIVKFTFVAMLTGIIRTSVTFWMPTYYAQYLGYDPKSAALLFTVSTLAISSAAFISVFTYERLGRNMNKTLLISFVASAISFFMLFLIKQPIINIAFMILSVLSANCAAAMLWSVYCPSLRDTGMISGATGFLDFVSYMAAAASSTIFANAVSSIGWSKLILVWFGLMVAGVVVALPKKIKK